MFNNIKKKMPRFTRFPFMWILVAIWLAGHYFDWSMEWKSTFGISMVLAAFGVLSLEYFKSTDISLVTFRIELGSALMCVLVVFITITCVVMKNTFSGLVLADYVLAVVSLLDAWLSPSASFATAQKNFAGANVSDGARDDAAED